MQALLITLLAVSNLSYAQSDEEEARSRLNKLQAEMKRITQEIASASSRKNNLQAQLRKAEVEKAAIDKKISDNKRSIRENRKQLAVLEDQQDSLEHAREQQRGAIARELRNAYQMGRQGQLKVLFNQEDPDTVARTMAYYRYFLAARAEQIASYRETLSKLAETVASITSVTAQLEVSAQELARAQENLAKAQVNRKQAVANLTASIESKGGALKQLQDDRQKLEQLLQAIEVAVVNLEVPEDFKDFSAAKGKMAWPVEGKTPKNRYGKYRNEGKMRWTGVTIAAKEGTPVHAIHHGRVVYADWLGGSGLLLIVDHGDGYMSLYAHNQTLLKEVGEWVTAGTKISTVGDSGGQTHSALYFEIRHNGKPTNPGAWCRG